jgi:hypothetical protein
MKLRWYLTFHCEIGNVTPGFTCNPLSSLLYFATSDVLAAWMIGDQRRGLGRSKRSKCQVEPMRSRALLGLALKMTARGAASAGDRPASVS